LSALQFNLCNSGIAPCFTGRSVAAAAVVIRHERPTIVTLNEICRGDLSVLKRSMPAARGAHIAAAFEPARDGDTHRPFPCVNGEQYGIGVLASIPSADTKHRAYSGVYPVQDPGDPEVRVWVCIDAVGAYFACTTHADDGSTTVALAQCRYLLSSAVPMIRTHDTADPVILGADLNLPAGGRPSPQSCLPSGYLRADDGARQDVVASPGFTLRSRTVIDMHGTTDHPALFVELGRSLR
jgi:hypothetical protein